MRAQRLGGLRAWPMRWPTSTTCTSATSARRAPSAARHSGRGATCKSPRKPKFPKRTQAETIVEQVSAPCPLVPAQAPIEERSTDADYDANRVCDPVTYDPHCD